MNKIYSISELAAAGKKIARLESNRNINSTVVKAKEKSLLEFGQLVPAVIVDAEVAMTEGLAIVDFETNEVITEEDASKYVVLIEGNHRYTAHLSLLNNSKINYSEEFYLIYPINDDMEIGKALAEINIATNPWKGADYIKGVKMNVKESLPVIDFMNELVNDGLSLNTASKVVRFDDKITKTVLVAAMQGNIKESLTTTTHLERGKRLYSAAKSTFPQSLLKSRTWMDWVISKYEATEDAKKAEVVEKLITFLGSLSKAKAEDIAESKGERGLSTKETIIYNKLNTEWAKVA